MAHYTFPQFVEVTSCSKRGGKPVMHSLLIAALFVLLPGMAWTQKPPVDLGLTPVEKEWLGAHPKIRLGIAPNSPPIEWINEKGTYSGIGADYVRLLQQRLGVELVPVTGQSWNEVLRNARDREIDVLPALARSPDREAYLAFTEPLLQLPMVVITQFTKLEKALSAYGFPLALKILDDFGHKMNDTAQEDI
jgi:ABC-type amino acid transport substrate-binding protein